MAIIGIVRGAQAAMVLLMCLAFYTTWGLVYENGTATLMQSHRDRGPHVLPGTKEPLRSHYTGFALIDHELTVLILFFWELVDGSRPNAQLLCLHFGGQIGAAYAVLLMESSRPHKRKTVAACVNIFGFLAQIFAFALVMPVYFLIDLYVSPGITSTVLDRELPDVVSLLTIPFSVFIGYIIPLILLALPAPALVTHDRKQLFMSIWQVFPLWVALSQFCLGHLLSRTDIHQNLSKLTMQRVVYLFAILVAASSHISSFLLISGSTYISSHLATHDPEAYSFLSAFMPDVLFRPSQVDSIGSGAQMFIQYDAIIGYIAFLLWATTLLRVTYAKTARQIPVVKGILLVVLANALSGPAGCAAVLLWLRDEELIKGQIIEGKDKRS